MRLIWSLIAVLTGLFSGSSVGATPQEYVRDAVAQLRANHINRGKVDWQSIEQRAFDRASTATTIEETYPIINEVINELGEPHTFLVPLPTGSGKPGSPPNPPLPKIEIRIIDRLGYIALPTFAGTGNRPREFATQIRQAVLDIDRRPVCGWIVDLRWNEGGNMYPALLGLGSIAGAGKLGSVVGGPIGQHWYLDANRVLISEKDQIWPPSIDAQAQSNTVPVVRGTKAVLAIEPTVAQPSKPDVPVAILLGPYTMSSGEGIAVSLMGRDNTRSFGNPTRGRSSANIGVKLVDGAMLIITYGVFADRTGKPYTPRVVPDVPIEIDPLENSFSETSAIIKAAREWLEASESCAAATP